MKSALIRLSLPFLLPFILAGCSAVTLAQLDNDWVRTYQARAEARKNATDFIASLSAFDANLAEISDRAAEEAAKQKDPATEVALYRVAILSAWQSGDKREGKVDGLSTSGSAACGKLKDRDKSQPRDCALFKIVPALAWHDKKAHFVESVVAKKGIGLTPEEKKDIPVVHADLYGAFERLMKKRAEILDLPLPKGFRDYVDIQWHGMYCTANKLLGLDAHTDTMEKNDTDMRYKLNNAGAWKPC